MKNQLFKVSLLALLVTVTSACTFDGDDGADGTPGAVGATGPAGADGVDGADGIDGIDGVDGDPGTNGNTAVYTVHFTNLTFNQPMSPAAVILHEPGYHAFIDGEAASVGIEMLAEAADPTILLDEASSSAQYLDSSTAGSAGAGTGPRGTSENATLVVPELDIDNLRLSFASMLGNTNDAFTGLNAIDVSNMTVGQSTSFMAPTWDAGTEANLESASTIPGPAASALGGGGASAGFDATRDDLFDRVHFHSGAVTNANADDASMEGISDSVLDESHRWNNPTAKITITRTR